MDMKRVLFFGLILMATQSIAQFPQLSKEAEISVLTMGPTQEELYSAFGHSAIRVHDRVQQFDLFYNYGVFNFNQPHFYLNFARGNLNYMMDVYDYAPYRDYYIEHNRYIHEQVLDLTYDQKVKIFNYLQWNNLPQNQYYQYDYFYNNCATKIRDVIQTALRDEVAFDSTFIKTNYTIRNLTDLYLTKQPWGDLGIDICLGLPMDKKASPFEYMFLPDYIESSFDHATNKLLGEPLVKEKISVYEMKPEENSFHWYHPWVVFGIVFGFVAFITWRNWRNEKISRWLDVVILLATGLIGILLFMLWAFTDHKAAAGNFNLMWAIPTHAFIAILLLFKKKPIWLRTYFLITLIICAALLAGWSLLPQALNVFLIPVVGMILMRSLLNYKLTR
jgi:hypothetical protein